MNLHRQSERPGKLVAEIFFGDTQWAEINQEGDLGEAEFYAGPDGELWRIDFQDAITALTEAKESLVGVT